LKWAVEQLRLYVIGFFEDLRNQIDIRCQGALDESNEVLMLEQQALLIEKVEEMESYYLVRIPETVKEDRATDMQLTIGRRFQKGS